MKKIFLLLITLLLLGCSKTVDVALSPEAFIYSSNDSSQKIQLSPDEAAYQDLNNWLAENKDGWYATSGRYAGGVYVRSGVHGIQIKELKVVIYSTSSEKPSALYVKDINRGELASLLAYKN